MARSDCSTSFASPISGSTAARCHKSSHRTAFCPIATTTAKHREQCHTTICAVGLSYMHRRSQLLLQPYSKVVSRGCRPSKRPPWAPIRATCAHAWYLAGSWDHLQSPLEAAVSDGYCYPSAEEFLGRCDRDLHRVAYVDRHDFVAHQQVHSLLPSR